MYKKYLIIYLASLLPLLSPLIGNYIVLERSGEYLSLSEIVATQQQGNFCLYGSGVHSDFYHYKLEGYTQTKPNIATIGSSRVMQLRQQFFTKSFYNLGGSVTSIDTAEHAIDQMFAIHVPEVLLIGIDYWWFLEESRLPVHTAQPPQEKQRRHLSSITLPFQWIQRSRLSIADYTKLLLHGRDTNILCRIGMRALEENSGFGPDGSHYYTHTYKIGTQEDTAKRLEGAMQNIINSEHIYRHNQTVRYDQIERFTALVKKIKDTGVEVVLFVPPIPPYLENAISQMPNEYAFFNELWEKIGTIGQFVHNFHNPNSIPITNCDFIDSGHADHVAIAKILQKISSNPNVSEKFKTALNNNELNSLISTKKLTNRPISNTCNKITNPLFYRYGHYPVNWTPAK